MWILDTIADFFAWLSHYSYLAYVRCSDVPLLGGPVGDFFYHAYDFTHSLAVRFYDLGDWADGIVARLDDILSWDTITGLFSDAWNRVTEAITEAWNWARDQVTSLWSYVTDHFTEIWSYVTDHLAELETRMTGYIADLFGDVTDHFRWIWTWIADFPTHAADAIWQWLTENLFQWLKDRAGQVVDVAGGILEAVW